MNSAQPAINVSYPAGRSTETKSGMARNVFWNLAGQAGPVLIAVFTVPLLIDGLGMDRFGILTLVWMVLSYFGLCDFGFGRALTQMIAEKIGRREDDEIPSLVWTSMMLMAAFGVFGSLIMIAVSPLLVNTIIKIPENLRTETLRTFYLLALSLPVVTCTTGLRGALEAVQRFKITATIRIIMGVFTFIGPALILPFSRSLLIIASVLVAGRVLTFVPLLVICYRPVRLLRGPVNISRKLVRSIVRLGGWMTVSNLVSPLMIYLDRFVIGAIISVSAVAYYVTPFEAVTKLLVIPGAFVGVLFPVFGLTFFRDSRHTTDLYYKSVKYIFLALLPVTLISASLAREILTYWLGSHFAENSYRVLQVLSLGVFINGIANVPFALIQGAGRSDLTAKINLLELPAYLCVMWWLISGYGIVGAAVAWLFRMAVDALLLVVVAGRLVDRSHFYEIGLGAFITLLIFGFQMLVQATEIRLISLMILIPIYFWMAWAVLMDRDDRSFLINKMKGIFAST